MCLKRLIYCLHKVFFILLVIALVLVIARDTIFSYEIDCIILFFLISASVILDICNNLAIKQYKTTKIITLVDVAQFAIFILFLGFLSMMRKPDRFEELILVNGLKLIFAFIQFGCMLLKSYLESNKYLIKNTSDYEEEEEFE